MCGRFALTATPEEVEEILAVMDIEAFPPRFNIAPTQPIMMVTAGTPREASSNMPSRQAVLVRWGLIPSWAKAVADVPLLFNARSETAAEKNAFRAAMRHRRALVPASGFYEWRRAAGDKDTGKAKPYWVRPRHGGLIAFAGLAESWLEAGGSEIDTGAILTTAANADLASIHHRMPVVIEPQDFDRWLDCLHHEPRAVADLLRPAEPGFFEAVPVSDRVNKVANVEPDIQAPVERAGDEAPPPLPRQMSLF